MHRTLDSLFLQTGSHKTCMEIKETGNIQERHFFPWHYSVSRHCSILIHSEPCPLEHSQRSYSPVIRILYSLERDADLLEQRLHLRRKFRHPFSSQFSIWMTFAKSRDGIIWVI